MIIIPIYKVNQLIAKHNKKLEEGLSSSFVIFNYCMFLFGGTLLLAIDLSIRLQHGQL